MARVKGPRLRGLMGTMLEPLLRVAAGSKPAVMARSVAAAKAALGRELDVAPIVRQPGRRGTQFPRTGPPGGVLRTVDSEGRPYAYARYDTDGNIVKRVDLQGRQHHGVPTPHTVEFDHNAAPSGEVFVNQRREVRPAAPEEVPW